MRGQSCLFRHWEEIILTNQVSYIPDTDGMVGSGRERGLQRSLWLPKMPERIEVGSFSGDVGVEAVEPAGQSDFTWSGRETASRTVFDATR